MKNLIIPIVLSLVILSCEADHTKYFNLKGEYSIAGVTKSENISWEEFQTLGHLDYGYEPFFFENDSILRVNQKVAKLLLSDSLFKYKITREEFKLIGQNLDVVHSLNYERNNELLNLYLTGNSCKRIQLVPADLSNSEK